MQHYNEEFYWVELSSKQCKKYRGKCCILEASGVNVSSMHHRSKSLCTSSTTVTLQATIKSQSETALYCSANYEEIFQSLLLYKYIWKKIKPHQRLTDQLNLNFPVQNHYTL